MSDDTETMWQFWRSRYGYVTALEDYFTIAVETHRDLQQAISQIKNAERAIDAIMEKLAND